MYLTTPEAGVSWSKAGGALFPYKNQDLANYSSELAGPSPSRSSTPRSCASTAPTRCRRRSAPGTFWSESVKLINGSQDLDTTLENIAASWPK